jgi:two-component system, response regulator YesN
MGMYKVLIVDDQALIRKGFIKMIKWDEFNLELAGEAENGNVALDLLKKNNVDIVITDMRMPKCDGISLLQSISQSYPDIRTIVISGYNNFEYARQAIKSGSLDYILKPVEPVDLNNAIKKACEIIEKNRKDSHVYYDEKQASRDIYQIIHGIDNAENNAFSSLIQFTKGCNMFCVAVIRLFDNSNIESDLHNIIMGFEGFSKILTFNDNKECLVIFCDTHESSDRYFESKIAKALHTNVLSNEAIRKTAVLGIGKICKKVDSIIDSYTTACEAIYYRLLDENRNIFIFEELVNREFGDIAIEQYESELMINITSGNKYKVESILHVILDQKIEKDKMTMQSIKLAISRLCYILLKVDKTLSNELQEFLDKINNMEYLWKFKSFQIIKQVLINMFCLTTQKYMENQGSKDLLVTKVKSFINTNYTEDISLETIGDSFHVSASHICRIFKQETGEGINEFITKVRIENAKKLLRSGNINIQQLAQMLGYSDHTYFYKVFKKTTGMTPKEYQNTKCDMQ